MIWVLTKRDNVVFLDFLLEAPYKFTNRKNHFLGIFGSIELSLKHFVQDKKRLNVQSLV